MTDQPTEFPNCDTTITPEQVNELAKVFNTAQARLINRNPIQYTREALRPVLAKLGITVDGPTRGTERP